MCSLKGSCFARQYVYSRGKGSRLRMTINSVEPHPTSWSAKKSTNAVLPCSKLGVILAKSTSPFIKQVPEVKFRCSHPNTRGPDVDTLAILRYFAEVPLSSFLFGFTSITSVTAQAFQPLGIGPMTLSTNSPSWKGSKSTNQLLKMAWACFSRFSFILSFKSIFASKQDSISPISCWILKGGTVIGSSSRSETFSAGYVDTRCSAIACRYVVIWGCER